MWLSQRKKKNEEREEIFMLCQPGMLVPFSRDIVRTVSG